MLCVELELPVLVDGSNGPCELLAQGLGKELLDGHVEFLGENDSETRVDVVLERESQRASCNDGTRQLTILEVPRATSLLFSLSSLCSSMLLILVESFSI